MIVLKKDYENETNIIYSLNDKLKITITEYFCGQQILFFFKYTNQPTLFVINIL